MRLRDSKGLADIAMLLSRPGREVHVAELVGVNGELGARPSADARVDDQAVAEYRRRLADLADEEDEAAVANDHERASRARAERDALVHQLSADLGVGGGTRPTDDWVERARKAVRTRVANSLKRIEAEHAPLGRHLRASVRTGAFCASGSRVLATLNIAIPGVASRRDMSRLAVGETDTASVTSGETRGWRSTNTS